MIHTGLDVVLGSENNWPILLALGAVVPAVIQVVMLPMMPESPRFTIINKQDEQTGKAALERLRDGDVTEEFDEIKSDAADAVNAEHVSVISLLTSKHLYLPLFICVTMHLSQQFSGIVAIFYYSTKFFINAGVSEESAKYATLGVGAILVTVLAINESKDMLIDNLFKGDHDPGDHSVDGPLGKENLASGRSDWDLGLQHPDHHRLGRGQLQDGRGVLGGHLFDRRHLWLCGLLCPWTRIDSVAHYWRAL